MEGLEIMNEIQKELIRRMVHHMDDAAIIKLETLLGEQIAKLPSGLLRDIQIEIIAEHARISIEWQASDD